MPVSAVERSGFNAIPDAMALEIGARFRLEVDDRLIQRNKVGHTRANAAHRIVTPPRFAGEVRKGADYVIVDDHVGLGGTLANLKGYIETRGARVVATSTLTESRDARRLALTPETLEALEWKHGRELDTFWRDGFGHGLNPLTEAEGGYILRGPSVDAIRTRLAQAAEEARAGGVSAGNVQRRGP